MIEISLIFRIASKGDLFREILKPALESEAEKSDLANSVHVEQTTVDLVFDNHITDTEFKVSVNEFLVLSVTVILLCHIVLNICCVRVGS